MRVLVVSKTVTNGGDFLFAKYTKDILQHEYPLADFVFDDAFREFTEEEIRQYSTIVIAGGPLYDNRLMTYDYFPFLKLAFQYSIPVMIIGGGVYGKTGTDKDIYRYRFCGEALEILQTIEEKGGLLGCRDFVTLEVLKNNGFSKLVMTGCPVWYDLDNLKKQEPVIEQSPEKIMISDPGVTKNPEEQISRAKQACTVIDYILQKFPKADLEFTFNNGIYTKYSSKCNEYIKNYLDKKHIQWYNLEKSAEAFSVYDSVSLHVGFRVHSHLYCMAHRIPSVLIEEDRRGFGMNDVLGLPHILGYDETEWSTETFSPNRFLTNKLDDVIDRMYGTEFIELKSAYRRMEYYYKTGMRQVLNTLKENDERNVS